MNIISLYISVLAILSQCYYSMYIFCKCIFNDIITYAHYSVENTEKYEVLNHP